MHGKSGDGMYYCTVHGKSGDLHHVLLNNERLYNEVSCDTETYTTRRSRVVYVKVSRVAELYNLIIPRVTS